MNNSNLYVVLGFLGYVGFLGKLGEITPGNRFPLQYSFHEEVQSMSSPFFELNRGVIVPRREDLIPENTPEVAEPPQSKINPTNSRRFRLTTAHNPQY